MTKFKHMLTSMSKRTMKKLQPSQTTHTTVEKHARKKINKTVWQGKVQKQLVEKKRQQSKGREKWSEEKLKCNEKLNDEEKDVNKNLPRNTSQGGVVNKEKKDRYSTEN